MPDTFSKEIRKKTMQAVKSKNTKLENIVMKELWKRGFRFRKNVQDLIGKPDIAIKKYRIVVFIDSCFWHGCELHYKEPETNRGYWHKKIEKNKERDLKISKFYEENGWHILRIWEHDIKHCFEETIEETVTFINRFQKKME